MFKVTFISLFPEAFDSFIEHSIIKKAIDKKLVEIKIINFREYSTNKHRQVDDYQYGGGPGMVIGVEALVNCLREIKTEDSEVWLTSPQGISFNQKIAKETSQTVKDLIIICGHYEGIDERIKYFIDKEMSLGDFVLTGGEFASQIMADSIIRLIDGVIKKESLESESFENYLLDYPVYTKPSNFEGYEVPSVLLSGNHKKIEEFRFNQQINRTKEKRPDLYKKYLKNKGE